MPIFYFHPARFAGFGVSGWTSIRYDLRFVRLSFPNISKTKREARCLGLGYDGHQL